MATSTERFGFTKPAGSDPASVVPLNSNTDLIEQYLGRTQDMIAPLYDDTATYDVGDIVTYESNLYKCITAISTAETFDPTKWEATTAVEEGSGGGGGSSVIPNPTGTPTDTLSTVSINGTIYDIEGSGGGGVKKDLLWEYTDSYNITLSSPLTDYDFLIFEGDNYRDKDHKGGAIVSSNLLDSIAGVSGKVYTFNGAIGEFANYNVVSDTSLTYKEGNARALKVWGIKYNAGGGGSSEAEDVNYDNTTSHLTADNVQKAIDEVVANVGTASEDILTLQNVQGYDKYDETQTYAVGDYAIYNNIVYECTTAVSTAEPFDSTKWTATSIEQIIDGVKGDISQLNSSLAYKSVSNLFSVKSAYTSIIEISDQTSYRVGNIIYVSLTLHRIGTIANGEHDIIQCSIIPKIITVFDKFHDDYGLVIQTNGNGKFQSSNQNRAWYTLSGYILV